MSDCMLRKVGMASAGATALFSVVYVLAQVLEWLGLLGSAGGPNSASTALGLIVLLLPSLLLGPSFVVLTAALHRIAPAERKVLSLAAFGFAIAYATLTGLVYFVQLTLVAPRLASGDTAGIEFLIFVPYRSFLFAVDLFGYSLMCVSTLLAAFALPEVPEARFAKLFLLLNGMLLPALAFQMLEPRLIWLGALWAVFFPAASIQLLRVFSVTRSGREGTVP